MNINTVRVTGAEKITAYGGGKRKTITYPDVGRWEGWKNHRLAARALADVLGYPVETTIACNGPLERRGRSGFAFTLVDYTVCWKCNRVLNDPDTGFNDATPYRVQAHNIDPEWTGAPDLVLCRFCTDDPGAYEQACATVRAWWMYSEEKERIPTVHIDYGVPEDDPERAVFGSYTRGIVDTDIGGIIAYVHADNAPELAKAWAQRKESER